MFKSTIFIECVDKSKPLDAASNDFYKMCVFSLNSFRR